MAPSGASAAMVAGRLGLPRPRVLKARLPYGMAAVCGECSHDSVPEA